MSDITRNLRAICLNDRYHVMWLLFSFFFSHDSMQCWGYTTTIGSTLDILAASVEIPTSPSPQLFIPNSLPDLDLSSFWLLILILVFCYWWHFYKFDYHPLLFPAIYFNMSLSITSLVSLPLSVW